MGVLYTRGEGISRARRGTAVLQCRAAKGTHFRRPPMASVATSANPAVSTLKVAPTENGCMIRIEGRGTMLESTAAKNVALATLKGDDCAAVVFDLSACDYLDSTFLGCIAELHRGFGRSAPPRF